MLMCRQRKKNTNFVTVYANKYNYGKEFKY